MAEFFFATNAFVSLFCHMDRIFHFTGNNILSMKKRHGNDFPQRLCFYVLHNNTDNVICQYGFYTFFRFV